MTDGDMIGDQRVMASHCGLTVMRMTAMTRGVKKRMIKQVWCDQTDDHLTFCQGIWCSGSGVGGDGRIKLCRVIDQRVRRCALSPCKIG